MIFCFLSESEKISCLVLKIIRELDKAAKPVDWKRGLDETLPY